MRGLARCQLSALDALGDAVLLILGAFADFTLGIGVLDCRIVLVLVNLVGNLILLSGQRLLVSLGQLAVVKLAHVALFLVDRGFLLFEIGGFAGGQLSALDSLRDAV